MWDGHMSSHVRVRESGRGIECAEGPGGGAGMGVGAAVGQGVA